ncbi:MAG: hypothetical protein LBT59_23315, partial [Clostridiales bacterium]|nr:hypothetical protein [Clostridiales bacterium]
MEPVNIDLKPYYINQFDANFKKIRFANNSKVGQYGCGVCCAAMIICWKLDISTVNGKQSVLKKVIADATNFNGSLVYTNVACRGRVFQFDTHVVDMAGSILKREPAICHLNGHFVLVTGYDPSKPGFEAYIVLDPISKKNTNLKEPMRKYGSKIIKKIT